MGVPFESHGKSIYQLFEMTVPWHFKLPEVKRMSMRRFRNHLILKSYQKKMMVGVNIRILIRHVKFDNDIVKWELFFVTVDQRVKDGFSSSRNCSITWPADVEIADFKDSGDCWGIMFPSDFFLVNKTVIKWTNQS